ncbi:MAG: SsrA-binding protein SmpB [Holosporales bacterium]|jgi:SsrA-binding protein|nr:SsrA-binding protein SmpB [Holosporales bacterium]
MKHDGDENFKIIAKNKRARFDYEILDSVEAGIALAGSEIKSIRNGKVSINESFVGPMGASDNELYLFNSDIGVYKQASYNNHEPRRPRKLLLHRTQINKFVGAIRRKGLTVVPMTMYFNHKGFVKISIALAKGKNVVDKRETIKTRDWNIQKAKVLKNYNSNK